MYLLDSAINILDKHKFKISLFLFCVLVFLLYILSKLVKFSNIEGIDTDRWVKEETEKHTSKIEKTANNLGENNNCSNNDLENAVT